MEDKLTGKLFIKIENKTGQRKEPWGEPCFKKLSIHWAEHYVCSDYTDSMFNILPLLLFCFIPYHTFVPYFIKSFGYI